MNPWTDGYVADVGYTFGYFAELNPLRAQLALVNAGLAPPDLGQHCELGFGQGLSTNLHAAASGHCWHGNDFNPAQAGFAQSVARASGADIHLSDEAFADFCARTDLPDFDSIGLHGIWSWISDANRTVIVNFIRRKLKVGGVLYVSYNTQPGLAAFTPMRHLLSEHAGSQGLRGQDSAQQAQAALDFADKLFATDPGYARANPRMVERLAQLKTQDRRYLAHEYLNRDWCPMHFSTVADWLAPAKLDYACSAQFLQHVDALTLTPAQCELLKDIPDARFRETVRDFMSNCSFRKDYWVKGARRLNPLEHGEALRAQSFMLVQPRADVSLKLTRPVETTLSAEIYEPILDAMADHQVLSLGQIEAAVKGRNIPPAQVRQAVIILCGTGALAGVQDPATTERAQTTSDKLNAHLMDKSRSNDELNQLASPVTGGGVDVPCVQQGFLRALRQGKQRPSEWAHDVWQTLAAQNRKIRKDGQVLDSAEDNLAELTARARTFADKQLPVLKALRVA